MQRCLFVLVCLALTSVPAAAQFALVGEDGRPAQVLVLPEEPAYVRLAAQDLISDVVKITGERPEIVSALEDCAAACVILGSTDVPASRALVTSVLPEVADALDGKWEAYRVEAVDSVEVGPVTSALVIAGSDARGTMFGLYRFIERYFGVDPMYFWTEREPEQREVLAWDEVDLAADEPTFRFRGWFLNDEDLLVGWKWDGQQRYIGYDFYHQATAPDVHARVFETMLRLGMNLVIPASFNDIANPDEAEAIRLATERGLFVTMHHIEPMGVSGYAYQNYWDVRGDRKPYSITRHPEAFEEVWRYYAGLWARYPNVIWQLGLRGIADRPVWVHDEHAPETDEGRGQLISDAIATQWAIVKEVDARPNPPATTTLWMEGAHLHQAGHLTFPDEIAVIFSDNSPGWTWQADFQEVPRQADRAYGVYYHHQLWGYGPHLAQGVPPQKTYAVLGEAVAKGDTYYAMLNVGNVREFALGLAASADMLRDYAAFRPDAFMSEWTSERFGDAAGTVADVYGAFFDAYIVDEVRYQGTQRLPVWLDGRLRQEGKALFARLLSRAVMPEASTELTSEEELERDLAQVEAQAQAFEAVGERAERVRERLDGEARTFFEANLLAHQRLMLGLSRWVEAGLRATLAERQGDRAAVRRHAEEATRAVETIRAGQALAATGRFADWYRGDRKMNIDEIEALTSELLGALQNEEARP